MYTHVHPHVYGMCMVHACTQVRLNLPDYLTVVTSPMDLGTIEKKLSAAPPAYASSGEFVEDVRLVWSNARLYNHCSSIVHQAALHCFLVFERSLWGLAGGGVSQRKPSPRRRKGCGLACEVAAAALASRPLP